jgi:hypothetical protein
LTLLLLLLLERQLPLFPHQSEPPGEFGLPEWVSLVLELLLLLVFFGQLLLLVSLLDR